MILVEAELRKQNSLSIPANCRLNVGLETKQVLKTKQVNVNFTLKKDKMIAIYGRNLFLLFC